VTGAEARGVRSQLPSTYTPAPERRFDVGDAVTVRRVFPPGHRRTPYYIRGKDGVIERVCGAFPNPEELAYGFDGEPKKVLYRVRFSQKEVWPVYRGSERDIIEMEIYEHWLEPVA
jgi:nitrile hydratase subunit beta